MNSLKIQNLKDDKYFVEIEDMNNTIQLKFTGIIDTQFPNNLLIPFFLEIDKKVTEHKLKNIYCNITKLDFINSRALSCFLNWVVHISSKNLSEQYKIHFILNKDEPWQKSSFNGLLKLHMSLTDFDYQ